MKNTSKVISLLLIVAMMATLLAGCGKKDKGYYSDSFSTIKWPAVSTIAPILEPTNTTCANGMGSPVRTSTTTPSAPVAGGSR